LTLPLQFALVKISGTGAQYRHDDVIVVFVQCV